MSSATVILPLERSRYFRDQDDVLSTSKAKDDIVTLTLDWSDQLASGETPSTATYVDSGVTTSGKSIAGSTTICTVTGIGETKITLITSAGRELVRRVRYYNIDGWLPRDYRRWDMLP